MRCRVPHAWASCSPGRAVSTTFSLARQRDHCYLGSRESAPAALLSRLPPPPANCCSSIGRLAPFSPSTLHLTPQILPPASRANWLPLRSFPAGSSCPALLRAALYVFAPVARALRSPNAPSFSPSRPDLTFTHLSPSLRCLSLSLYTALSRQGDRHALSFDSYSYPPRLR
jgi:hypothetical protein